MIDFGYVFHCLPNSAWADEGLVEWAENLGEMGGIFKSMSTKPRSARLVEYLVQSRSVSHPHGFLPLHPDTRGAAPPHAVALAPRRQRVQSRHHLFHVGPLPGVLAPAALVNAPERRGCRGLVIVVGRIRPHLTGDHLGRSATCNTCTGVSANCDTFEHTC